MAFGYGYGFWLKVLIGKFRKADVPWITNGSEVQQAPDGPTVTWGVNGSVVANSEV